MDPKPRRQWGRLYGGTRNHRKIKVLRDQFPDHWTCWYVLIDLAIEIDDQGWICVAPGVPFDFKQLAKEIGIRRGDVCERFIKYLQSLQLLEIFPEGIFLKSFKERNFDSDISTTRVQKYRENLKKVQRNGRQMKRFSNVSETDQSRAEQKQNRAEQNPPLPPKGGTRAAAFSLNDLGELWNAAAPTELPRVNLPFSRPAGDLKKLEAAVGRHADLEWWGALFRKLYDLPGLKGENDKRWKASFDFVVQKGELILDGKYDGWGMGKEGGKPWYA